MGSPAEDGVRDIAIRWKRYDPSLYDQFLRLMDKWTFEVTVTVTKASSADILQAQGHAQQQMKVMQLFVDAAVLADQPPPKPAATATPFSLPVP